MGIVEIIVAETGPLIIIAGAIYKLFSNSITKRDKKIELLQAQLDVKDEMIAVLKEQNRDYRVTARIQEHFFTQLPLQRGKIKEISDEV